PRKNIKNIRGLEELRVHGSSRDLHMCFKVGVLTIYLFYLSNKPPTLL
ncbi:hypothetical protein L915_01579, partial [Phytophthora nicotianae]